ncbi:MAG: ATP-binding cassette domain-containing protein [Chloroflexota bacterium]|nr:ATP-binding cassette domain-containing protein [Chloroflexota bacterium]
MPTPNSIPDAPAGAIREDALLEVKRLKKYFPIQRGLLRKVVGQIRAVDDVSFFVRPGETLSLVGESGCGKTTTARCVLRAVDPTEGEVLFRAGNGSVVDIASVPRASLRPLRREMQMIFQDPFSSLNSRMTLLDIVGEPLEVNGVGNRQERTDRVAELLRLVGLRPEYMRRYPHAFSGGQRQRIGIARALALNPRLVVADEPVSALDVSVQAQILNLMLELQERLGLTYLFVAHDLSVVKHISDRVAVMYVGQMVEMAETNTLFSAPKHPYTAALLSAIPEPDPQARRRPARRPRSGVGLTVSGNGSAPPREVRQRVVLQGEVANPAAPPSGCYFHPRCQYALDVCKTTPPVWEELEPGHFVRCHRSRELQLPGVSGAPGH